MGIDLKRVFDLFLCLSLVPILLVPMLLLWLLVKLTSEGPVIYWSVRVGQLNRNFNMPKFRSLKIGAPTVATDLLRSSDVWVTPIGSFLRKSSLDELPQIWSILKGDMSFVGPRPALFNQYKLINLRTENGVHVLRPGLTGWAQVNGRDELTLPVKVQLEVEYMQKKSFLLDLKILVLTAQRVITSSNISH